MKIAIEGQILRVIDPLSSAKWALDIYILRDCKCEKRDFVHSGKSPSC